MFHTAISLTFANKLAFIANCDTIIAICDMKLSDKIRYLREVEGGLRGLDRAMTQQELVRAIQESNKVSSGSRKAGATISQSYLSQIESGARPHLTNTTRLLLAKFFQVHPGYLVDDPEGYNAQLLSDIHNVEDKLDLWLISGAERFRRDPDLCQALLSLAQNKDSRRCLLLLEAVLNTPSLVDRLLQVLRPEASASQPGNGASASTTQRKAPPTRSTSKRGKQ
jgi:transcriptional regulator with XRE-family HTH domain